MSIWSAATNQKVRRLSAFTLSQLRRKLEVQEKVKAANAVRMQKAAARLAERIQAAKADYVDVLENIKASNSQAIAKARDIRRRIARITK